MHRNNALALFCGVALSVTVHAGHAGPADVDLSFAPGAFGRLANADPVVKGGDFAPSYGNYFDPGNPGWGLDIQRVGDLLFVIWFTYRPDGTPIWYVVVGELDGMSWSGNIDTFKWDPFGDLGSQATATTVGTMSITWSDENNAMVSWTLNGIPGSADVSFAVFSSGPTLANLTGHYFPFYAPGWGLTLLTQGEFTVITMYFYQGGQPVWLQGVVSDPGFFALADMNYFFAPDLCPSCLDKAPSGKANYDFELTATVGYQYDLGAVQDLTIHQSTVNAGGPMGSNPFADIDLNFSAVTVSSITGAYMNYYLASLDDDDGGLPAMCAPFEYRQNLMTLDPMPTGPLNTLYVNTERSANGNNQVFLDPDCLMPHTWQSNFDQQFYQSWVQLAPTNTVEPGFFATQQKWFITIPQALDFGQETCDIEEGIGSYGTKRLSFNAQQQVDGFEVYTTGVTSYTQQTCTDGFRFMGFLDYQVDLPTNQEFVDDPDDYFMARLILTY